MPIHFSSDYQTCPHCGSGEVHATVWNGLIERWVLYLWGLTPYQCRCCCERFYRRRAIQQKRVDRKAA
jgi:hypothetical protein